MIFLSILNLQQKQYLCAHHRFLIHRVVEKGFTKLTSFSIGEDTDRRTVICFEENKLHQELKVSRINSVRRVFFYIIIFSVINFLRQASDKSD